MEKQKQGGLVEVGMMLMILSMFMAPVVGTMGKWMSSSISAGEIAWGRFFFQFIFLLPFAIAARRGMGPHIGLQILRGALMALATLLFFAAVRVLPLADAMAIFFVEPLILTIMSSYFLGETIGWRRWTAILVGFSGALIVIQPSYRVFGLEAVFPIGTAFCLAGYLVLTRRLVVKGDALMLQVSSSLFGCLTLALALVVGHTLEFETLTLTWPTSFQWSYFAIMAAIATVVHLLIVYAFRLARASILAPFQYIEIISATTLGFFVFGEFPDSEKWLGILVIIVSGLYVYHRERTLARDNESEKVKI